METERPWRAGDTVVPKPHLAHHTHLHPWVIKDIHMGVVLLGRVDGTGCGADCGLLHLKLTHQLESPDAPTT